MEQELEKQAAPVVLGNEQTEPPPPAVVIEDGPPGYTPSTAWLDEAGIEIVRATRSWIQYGAVGFAVFCIVIGAVEGLLGR